MTERLRARGVVWLGCHMGADTHDDLVKTLANTGKLVVDWFRASLNRWVKCFDPPHMGKVGAPRRLLFIVESNKICMILA
jgi:hypothetical protein